MGTVYAIITGQAENGPDPALSEEGRSQMCAVKAFLTTITELRTKHLGHVICGTGRRHIEMAEGLGLLERVSLFADIVGSSAILQNTGEKKEVLFPCGKSFTAGLYDSLYYSQTPAVIDLVAGLRHNSVVITGKECMILLLRHLRINEVTPGSVFAIESDDERHIERIVLVHQP